MKFLNFGSANIDYVYALDHIVLRGETISSESLNLFPGGKEGLLTGIRGYYACR